MSQNYWLIILFVAAMVCNEGFCRPRELDLTNIRPVYGAVKQVESEPPNRSGSEAAVPEVNKESKFSIESIATVARASNNGPSSAVIDHIVDTVSQMVVSDIRTPPKLREIVKEENSGRRDALGEGYRPMPVTFVYEDDEKPDKTAFAATEKFLHTDTSVGKASVNSKIMVHDGAKGVAIPVMMDETEEATEPIKKLQKITEFVKPVKDERKKTGVTKVHVTTTPSSGLSTWILLSDNREPTTPSPKRVNNKKDAEEKKKTTMGTPTTTKKPSKVQSTTTKAPTTVKKTTAKPGNSGTRRPDAETSATSALEALVKTQKKGTSTTTIPSKSKTTESKTPAQKRPQTDSKKKLPEKVNEPGSNDRIDVTVPDTKTVYTIPPHLPLTTETSLAAGEKNSASSVTENTVEGTTKKKTTTKKKKKNKKKKKTETGVEPKIPTQPVGSQIYNFLSREIVPTVGLGLIGVALTAGLASFLGYNPFVSSAVPLRRTYETSHGYSPTNYYTYNTDYGDGGQSEEVLLREVLSGMPEESRYELTRGDSTYSDMYNRNDQSSYDMMKTSPYSSQTGTAYNSGKGTVNYDSAYSQDFPTDGTYDLPDKSFVPDYSEKYPVYTRETGTSFVYPETPAMTSEVKSTRQTHDQAKQNIKTQKVTKTTPDTIERQPEALYRVSGDEEQQYRNREGSVQEINPQDNWHRMGTPMEPVKQYSRLEPGPRSLDLTKESGQSQEKKRTKRDVSGNIQRIARKRTPKETDAENEIDFEDDTHKTDEDNFPAFLTNTETTTEGGTSTTASPATSTTTDSTESSTIVAGKDENPNDSIMEESSVPFPIDDDPGTDSLSQNASFLDILKRLAQFKLRLGLNFLRSTTDMFSRYLDVIQRKVDESFTNTTTVQYNRRKSPWSRIFFGGSPDNSLRTKRSALQENPLLTSLLNDEAKFPDGYSKSTKKELKTSSKAFFAKKSVPKKYEPKTNH